LISESCFYDTLAIVKITFNSKIKNIITHNCCHLSSLHFRHSVMRVQNKNIHMIRMTTTFKRCRSCITGSRTKNYDPLIVLLEHIVQQPTQHLKSKILKSQGRTMVKLQQIIVASKTAQGRNLFMIEFTVAFFNYSLKFGVGNFAIHKWRNNLQCQFGIIQRLPGTNLFHTVVRQISGHKETAVRSHACK